MPVIDHVQLETVNVSLEFGGVVILLFTFAGKALLIFDLISVPAEEGTDSPRTKRDFFLKLIIAFC